MPIPRVRPKAVFLNVPYDDRFRAKFLAYIVGLSHLGLEPYTALGIPGGERRLDRILNLIQSCRYSIHDLSRVQLNSAPPPTPRFNMPFELGLSITWQKLYPHRHNWFVFEAHRQRLHKSLSDLDGTDPNIHDGTVEGVMRELCNAFVRARDRPPTVPAMMLTYRKVKRDIPGVLLNAGAQGLFEARVFRDLCFVALGRANER